VVNEGLISHGGERKKPPSHSVAASNCPLWVDAVDKVGDVHRTGNNRIQVPRFLNQCCAPDSNLESMLLTRPSKNVFRQHRSEAEAAYWSQTGGSSKKNRTISCEALGPCGSV
jgi:hypothetical protein